MAYADFEAVIGLEIHVQLKTESKMFCACSTKFGVGDNENTCPVCTGQPGALPRINAKAVELAVKVGKALNCTIDRGSVFARKNYFYPDMPRGYQISQYERPICGEGQVEFYLEGEKKKIRIERAHLEEDAGKSTHHGHYSLVNLNRASTPLLEIVSAPEMTAPNEAAEYARNMRRIVRYLDVCDGNLEEGSMRCDCNVSVRKKGETKLGTKVEIKNLNSFRFIEKALQFEIERQIDVVDAGGEIVQETRLYDIDKNKTFSMRSKEEAADYRYFPEPDLVQVSISEDKVKEWQEGVIELPIEKRDRFVKELKLSESDADQLTDELKLAEFFEKTAQESKAPKSAANWILGEWLHHLNADELSIEETKVSAEKLGKLIQLVESGTISGTAGKKVFAELWQKGGEPEATVEKLGLKQVSDVSAIEKMVDEVLQNATAQVEQYRSGKTKVFGFFVGQVMKASRGQANPDVVNEILQKKLQN